MTLTENRLEHGELSDGARIEDLFDLDERKIKGRVFSDPEIHRRELTQIFERSWLFVGLVSEIPNPGDYMVRRMGADQVIVTRDADGAVNIILNRCAHRGVQLCMTDCGNAKRFKCPYHGWVFDPKGRVEAMVAEREWLGPDDSKENYRIRPARVAIHAGLIFGNWDEDAPDFVSSLGDFRWYFDIMFNAFDKPLAAVGPPQRWVVNYNWKLGTENFVGDGYHAPTAHGSQAFMMGADVPADMMVRAAYGIAGCEPDRGHGFYAATAGMQEIAPVPHPKWAPPSAPEERERNLTPDQAMVVRHGALPIVGTLFPNFSWIGIDDYFLVRTWEPIGPDQTEIRNWTVAHADATEEFLRAADQGMNHSFGMTGMLEQDDMTLWSRTQRTLVGSIAVQEWMHYACSRAPDSRDFLPDGTKWPGPGPVWQGFAPDDHLWNFHLRWLDMMTGE